MKFLLVFLMVLYGPFAMASGSNRPAGLNCNLATPPPSAGEDENHGIIFKIYPRIADMPKNYSGCQTLWEPQGSNWSTISIVAIEHGYAVRIWFAGNADPIGNSCRYKQGKLVHGGQQCPSAKFLIQASVPAGCMQRILASEDSSPPGCELDAITQ